MQLIIYFIQILDGLMSFAIKIFTINREVDFRVLTHKIGEGLTAQIFVVC